jgi:DNA-binding CsgD family transcriptional regulator
MRRHLFGIGAYSYRLGSSSVSVTPLSRDPIRSSFVEDPETGAASFAAFVNQSPLRSEIVANTYAVRKHGLIVLSELAQPMGSELLPRLPTGAKDSLCLHSAPLDDSGFHLCMLIRAGFSLNSRRRAYLHELARFIAHGYRVQYVMQAAQLRAHEIMAVSSPDGRLLHADPSLQTADSLARFAHQVRALERLGIRSVRAGVNEGERLWSELLAGGYIIIESSESDGRRRILAVRSQRRSPEHLTPQQRRVVELVAQGYSNKRVGAELGLESNTVGVHLRSALHRLGCPSRQALVLWWNTTRAP